MEDWQNGNAAVLKTVARWAWGFESSILRMSWEALTCKAGMSGSLIPYTQLIWDCIALRCREQIRGF